MKTKRIETLEFPKRMGTPGKYGDLVAFLVQSSYMNGEPIRIDAGTRPPPH